MATLVYIAYSPWSQKAAWALDHHRVVHEREAYVPMLGEPLLRLRCKKLRGKITLPVLMADGEVWDDSLGIARYAEEVGRGAPLFHAEQVEEYNSLAETLMASGRARATERVASDQAALLESLPAVAKAAGPLAQSLGTQGVAFLRKKYGTTELSQEQHLERMCGVLERIRSDLKLQASDSGPSYLLGGFSFADIAMACALQFVRPVSDRYIRLGPASRAAWADPQLTEYEDLLTWRDRIFQAHR